MELVLFSDSSSEDEEIEIQLTNNMCLMQEYANMIERKTRVSVNAYVEDVVQNYSRVGFIRMFRMDKSIVQHLSLMFERSPAFIILKDKGGRPVIDSFKQFLIYLWFLGHETVSYNQIVDRFDVAKSTVFEILTRVSNFVCQDIGPKTIKFPDQEKKNSTKEYFHSRRFFPGIIALVDGSHIRVDKPLEDPDSYINRNKYYSIQVQVTVNERLEFYNVFVGYPGSVHDARVFRNSSLYESLPNICQKGEYVLGDSAYPCLNTILTPYRDNGNLTTAQRNFNYIHSQCRVKVQHAIGKVKQRFRSLYHMKLRCYSRMIKIFFSCFVLCNLADKQDCNFKKNRRKMKGV